MYWYGSMCVAHSTWTFTKPTDNIKTSYKRQTYQPRQKKYKIKHQIKVSWKIISSWTKSTAASTAVNYHSVPVSALHLPLLRPDFYQLHCFKSNRINKARCRRSFTVQKTKNIAAYSTIKSHQTTGHIKALKSTLDCGYVCFCQLLIYS